MKNRILVVVSSLFLVVSCLEEASFDTPNPALGQEVGFAARVSNPETKTLYGTPEIEIDEETGKVTRTSIKVKWVHDDKITVYGTNCADGRKQAEYAVKTYVKTTQDGTTTTTEDILGATPNTGDGQNYADELVKTGSFGVQWGTETTSDFYAVYPSVKDGDIALADDEESVIVNTSISTTQYLSFNGTTTTLQGIPYDGVTKKYGMSNALMYACTSGAEATSETVDLAFIPFSTVLNFSIPTWYGKTGSDLAQKEDGKSIVVKSIKVTAPQEVFGEFALQLNNDGTANVKAGTDGTSNVVTLQPTEQLKWTYGQNLEFSVFAIPLDNVSMSGWTVAIEMVNTEQSQDEKEDIKKFTLSGNEKILQKGSVHNVRIATGFPVETVWKYSTETWLETVPRNVYISDISLPGAWYATDSGYQGGTLAQQFAAGIRAFNIDCRLSIKAGLDSDDFDNKYVEQDYTDGNLVLACAGTEVEHTTNIVIAKVPNGKMDSIGKTVKQALIELGKLIVEKKATDEYIEVILTVAEKSKTNSGYNYGTVNPKMVLKAICDVLNDGDVKKYLYGNEKNEIITPNTTIGDVAGKIVVKVNMNTSAENIRSWGYAAPMLISEASMAPAADSDNKITAGVFGSMNSSEMYWSNSYITDSNKPGYMQFHYHQCQNTTGSPSVANRKGAISDLLNKSYGIYKDNTHNAMFQLGIGGWTNDNDSGKKNLSSQLNPYVYGIINSMLTGVAYEGVVYTPAPVGAVLMNFATAGTSVDNDERDTKKLIKSIIDLNGKYFLNRDNTKPEWPGED